MAVVRGMAVLHGCRTFFLRSHATDGVDEVQRQLQAVHLPDPRQPPPKPLGRPPPVLVACDGRPRPVPNGLRVHFVPAAASIQGQQHAT